jgi:hypothetical protein
MHDTAYDDAARLRILQGAADDSASRNPPSNDSGVPCVVAKVFGGASSGLNYFTMRAQRVTGAETEGGPGTLTDAGYSFVALNLGSATPATSTAVICTFVDWRWVFRYDN